MKEIRIRRVLHALPLAALLAVPAAPAPIVVNKDMIHQLYPIPSATGNEERLASAVVARLPKNAAVERDHLGGVYAKLGAGETRLAIVTALDESGYVISNILPDGYLQLDRLSTPLTGISDSFLMGHAVAIATRAGLSSGIVVQPAMHLLTAEMRDRIAKGPGLDMIFVDVGARSEAEVRAKGIEILDPVTFSQDLSTLANGRMAGTALGLKANVALLTDLARTTAEGTVPQTTAFGWMVQTRLSARGSRSALGAALAKAKLAPKAALVLGIVSADRGEKSPVLGKGPVLIQAKEGSMKLREAVEAAAKEKGIALQFQTGGEGTALGPFLADGGDALVIALPVKFAGTPSEVVDPGDMQAVLDLVLDIVRNGRLQ
jgi:putative aminopeptidase FrvX